jgi:ribosomal protein S20
MNNQLKYWRVIRYWVKAKYGLGTPELEMMLFLYSEEIFNKSKFLEFDKIMSWDEKRFNNLLRDGWIHVWRKRAGKNATLYELSHKGKSMIRTVYRKLNGDEIGESPNINPLFKLDASYMDKQYRNMIIEMNKFIRQQRHLSQE